MSTSADSSDSSQYQTDPTRTTTVRRRLGGELSSRVRDVRGAVRRQIEQQGPTTTLAGVATAGFGGIVMLRSLSAFRRWLSGLFDAALLGTAGIYQARRGRHFTAPSIRSAYETGLRRSRSILRQRDYDIGSRSYEAVIADDRHQNALAREYERAYIDIEDAIDNTVSEVSRTIADGGYIGADEVNQQELADLINERIDANYGKRLSPLGDSIPVRSANTAAIEAYHHAGVSEIGIDPEAVETKRDVDWIHANDDNVCAECRALALNAPYKLADIIAGNPAPPPSPHLRCRCFLVAL